jgi:enoyl-CoA hydratase/carnithine racemase
MPYREIAYSSDGPISCLTQDNPSKINAPSTTMVAELSAAIDEIRNDENKSRHSSGIGKQAFYEQVDMEDEKALAYGSRTIALNCLAKDAQTGTQAFPDKKPRGWQNR